MRFMHAIAVVALCALLAYFLWSDLAGLMLAWYSGSDQEISRKARWLIGLRTVAGLLAGSVALLTL